MARKRVYIHIGPSKTGSTTLQHALTEQSEWDSSLIYYPKAGRLNDGQPTQRSNKGKIYTEQYHVINHTNVYYALMGTMINPSNDDILNMLAREINECPQHDVVISSEGFFGLSDQVKRLIGLLGDCSVKVLLYIRNPNQRTISSYREKVRTENMTRSFENFVSEEGSFVNEPSVIDRWASCLGPDNIITRPFEEVVADPGLFQDFCNAIGVKGESFKSMPEPERVNTSLNDQTLVAFRFLSKMQKRFKTGGFAFLVCINLKHIMSRSAFVRAIVGCMLFPLRNQLISPAGVSLMARRIEDEIINMPPHYRSLYAHYIKGSSPDE